MVTAATPQDNRNHSGNYNTILTLWNKCTTITIHQHC